MAMNIFDASNGEPISAEVLDPFNFPDYRDPLQERYVGPSPLDIERVYQAVVKHGVDGLYGDLIDGFKDLIAPYFFDVLQDAEIEECTDDMNVLLVTAACLILEWNRL